MTNKSTSFGFIGLIGAPNAGKSTLCNALVGTKVGIVTHKVQTTRVPVRGLFIEDQTQVVLVDTPGIMTPKRKLEAAMVRSAWNTAGDVDRNAFLLDAARFDREATAALLSRLGEGGKPLDLILNKIDKVEKSALLGIVDWLKDLTTFDNIFMISALKASGLEGLRKTWAKALPEGPWHYPKEQMIDLPLKLAAAEITREKLFLNMHAELPYQLSVLTESWEEHKNGALRIGQVVYVERETHKRMVLGKGGQSIRRIGAEARQELKEMFGTEVHLFLFVKVASGWTERPQFYSEVGLDFD